MHGVRITIAKSVILFSIMESITLFDVYYACLYCLQCSWLDVETEKNLKNGIKEKEIFKIKDIMRSAG